MDRVAVIGAGMMGAGIAEVCARSGSAVTVIEVDADGIAAGKARIVKTADWGLRTGKLSEADRDAMMKRLTFSVDLGDVADRELVIESAVERQDVKQQLFRDVDRMLADEAAIIASNTSSIPIVRLARATERADRVIGMHFFNPVPIQPLVELVPSLLTSDETLDRCRSYAAALGKQPIESKDRSGFIVNVLLVPYLLSAIRLVDIEFASAADIDTGMVLGAAHRMGPLAVADFIGIDTLLDVANVLYDEFKDPAFVAPPLLSRMVEAGRLGRKTGRGFHDYGTPQADPA